MMGSHCIIEAWDLIEGRVYPPVTSWLQHRLESDFFALCYGDTLFCATG